jgi:hypothetical protein
MMTEENKVLWEVEEEAPAAVSKQEEVKAEEAKPDPQKEYGKRAEQRIRQLVRKAKTAEENARAAAERAAKLEEDLGSLKETVSKLQQGTVAQTREQLQSAYASARARYVAAREAGNTAEEVAASEAMQDARIRWATSGQVPQAQPRKEERQFEEEQPQRQQGGVHPRAKSWIDGKDWWETDPVARGAAIAVAQKLDAEGWDPDDDAYYEEVDRLLKPKFPEHYGVEDKPEKRLEEDAPKARVAQTVAGGSRTSATSGNPNKVKLTPNEVKLANKMRIPLEVYAQEKFKMQQATTSDGRVLPVEITTRRS